MAADWFHKLGFTLPYGTNVADFILDLASGAILTDERWALGFRGRVQGRGVGSSRRCLRVGTRRRKSSNMRIIEA